jgi:hypothetical protein
MEHLMRRTLLALVATVVAVALVFALAPAVDALPGRWTQRNNLRRLAVQMSNNSLRYLHTTWWSQNYAYSTIQVSTDATGSAQTTQTLEALVPYAGFSAGEVPIRGQASALYATAIALESGYYSPAKTGVSAEEARRRTVAWTTGLAESYARGSWGRSWQSPLWVNYLGYGARRVWPSLPARTQDLVTAAVASEADHLLAESPRHYRDSLGRIVNPGDSQSEENAWSASLLLFAAREFPSNPHAAQWESHGRVFLVNAYAAPDQVGGDPRVAGSNINPNGTVVNHTIIHPDYMLAQAEFIAKIALVSADTGTQMPPETRNNQALIWNALTRVSFPVKRYAKPGGTIYRWGPKRRSQTSAMYFPQGNDWGQYRRFNAAQMDVEVFAAGLDWRSYSWATQHMNYVLKQQSRYSDRHIFPRGTTRYPGDEQFAAVTAAEIAARLIEMQ